MYVCVDYNEIDKLKEKEEERIFLIKVFFVVLIKGILYWFFNLLMIYYCILICVVFFYISFFKLVFEIRILIFKFLYIKCRFYNVYFSVLRM